jgi:hypothetical protein
MYEYARMVIMRKAELMTASMPFVPGTPDTPVLLFAVWRSLPLDHYTTKSEFFPEEEEKTGK